jgi:hypothetical protein
MKSRETQVITIEGCGSKLIDRVMDSVNYELSGDGAVLVHTDDLENTTDDTGLVGKVLEYLNNPNRKDVDWDTANYSIPYEGLILLRR